MDPLGKVQVPSVELCFAKSWRSGRRVSRWVCFKHGECFADDADVCAGMVGGVLGGVVGNVEGVVSHYHFPPSKVRTTGCVHSDTTDWH